MFLLVTLVAGVAASVAIADADSDRRDLLRAIDDKIVSVASELSGVKSDSDDGDIRDADGYSDQVRDLVGKLDSIKGDDSKAREVVDRYPGYVDRFKRANAALRSMKGYQSSNVTVMKVCKDKDEELVAQARDFESRNDPEGLEKLPRIASDFKNMTVRVLEEAEKFRSQMEDWFRTVDVKYYNMCEKQYVCEAG